MSRQAESQQRKDPPDGIPWGPPERLARWSQVTQERPGVGGCLDVCFAGICDTSREGWLLGTLLGWTAVHLPPHTGTPGFLDTCNTWATPRPPPRHVDGVKRTSTHSIHCSVSRRQLLSVLTVLSAERELWRLAALQGPLSKADTQGYFRGADGRPYSAGVTKRRQVTPDGRELPTCNQLRVTVTCPLSAVIPVLLITRRPGLSHQGQSPPGLRPPPSEPCVDKRWGSLGTNPLKKREVKEVGPSTHLYACT